MMAGWMHRWVACRVGVKWRLLVVWILGYSTSLPARLRAEAGGCRFFSSYRTRLVCR